VAMTASLGVPDPATQTSDRIRRLLPYRDRDLSRPQLRTLADSIARQPDVWFTLIRQDRERRHYVQLYRDMYVDVWLICWVHGQSTGIHDHDGSAGAVSVCSGDLVEDQFDIRGRSLNQSTIVRRASTSFDFGPVHVHQVRHPGGGYPLAVSIHVYSPAIIRMGYYEVDENGLLRRSTVEHIEEAAV